MATMSHSLSRPAHLDAPGLVDALFPPGEEQPAFLGRAISAPVSGDAAGPIDALLSPEEEQVVLLGKATSTPVSGDHSLHTTEMFITAQELVNGVTHELGWFPPVETVGEIKRMVSERMCVPPEALRMVSGSSIASESSLESDHSTLGEVWPRFGPGSNLIISVQALPDEELLKSVDDIRVHEGAYDKLANLACQFEGKLIPPSNANFLKHVTEVICRSLHEHETRHMLSRAWATQALTKLLKHSIRQLHICNYPTRDGTPLADSSEKLEGIIQIIVEEFQELSQKEVWIERDEALLALRSAVIYSRICAQKNVHDMGLDKLSPDLFQRLLGATSSQLQTRSQLGGA